METKKHYFIRILPTVKMILYIVLGISLIIHSFSLYAEFSHLEETGQAISHKTPFTYWLYDTMGVEAVFVFYMIAGLSLLYKGGRMLFGRYRKK